MTVPPTAFHLLRSAESGLFNDYQRGIFHDALALFHADGSDLSVFLGFDIVGHLHGFQHNNSVAGLYFLTYFHFYRGYHARQWSLALLSAG